MPAAEAAAPELTFAVERAAAERYAAAPTLRLTLRVESGDERPVQGLLLDVQVRIAARRRAYAEAEEERLTDVFGPVGGWKTSLSSLLWAQVPLYVPTFTRATAVDLPLACTYDFEVAAAKYVAALRAGHVPLELLFGGTILYGARRMARLPLDREARFDLPLDAWRDAVEACFPGTAWLRVRRESFDRLAAYRARRSLPTWEATLDALLEGR